MTISDPPGRPELTDDQLDSLLHAADDELHRRIQAAVNPANTLTAAMNTAPQTTRPDDPGETARAGQAALLVMQRGTLLGINRTLERAGNGARDLDIGLARDLDIALAHALGLALARDRDLDLGLARDLGRASGLARDLARASDLGRASDLASGLARDLGRANRRASDLARIVSRRKIVASGADLSRLDIDDVGMVVNVIWDEATRWPSGIADRVRAASQEIGPGVYQVVGGSERDPAWHDARR